VGLRDFSRPENIGERARQLKEGGFLIFKIKIGQQDHQKDMTVREAVGNDAFIGATAMLCIPSSMPDLS
jgi:L-alanine-DL-glutamate epimerase-like enolase superfamily enzyme